MTLYSREIAADRTENVPDEPGMKPARTLKGSKFIIIKHLAETMQKETTNRHEYTRMDTDQKG